VKVGGGGEAWEMVCLAWALRAWVAAVRVNHAAIACVDPENSLVIPVGRRADLLIASATTCRRTDSFYRTVTSPAGPVRDRDQSLIIIQILNYTPDVEFCMLPPSKCCFSVIFDVDLLAV